MDIRFEMADLGPHQYMLPRNCSKCCQSSHCKGNMKNNMTRLPQNIYLFWASADWKMGVKPQKEAECRHLGWTGRRMSPRRVVYTLQNILLHQGSQIPIGQTKAFFFKKRSLFQKQIMPTSRLHHLAHLETHITPLAAQTGEEEEDKGQQA